MSTELRTLDKNIITTLVLKGDMKGLTPTQKVEYYNYRCQQAGLDPSAKPFDVLTFQGREVLYANAGCAQQLRMNRNLSVLVTGREKLDDIYCVFCEVKDGEGHTTQNMGSLSVAGLKGEALANAFMKATTKAIRRSILAHCGLGMLDEDEVLGQEWTKDHSVVPVARPGDCNAPEHQPKIVDGDGDSVFVWSEDQKLEFYNLCDSLLDLGQKAGETEDKATERLTFYKGQQSDTTEDPVKVLNRMYESCGRLENKIKKAVPQ